MANKRQKSQRKSRRISHKKSSCKHRKTAKGLFSCWSKDTGARKTPSPQSSSPQYSLKHSPTTNLTPGTIAKYIKDANKWYDIGYGLNEQKTALEEKLYNTKQEYENLKSKAKIMHNKISQSSPKTRKKQTTSAVNLLRRSKRLIPKIKLLENNIKHHNYLENLNFKLAEKLHDLIKPNKRSTRRNIIKDIHKLQEQIKNL